MNAMSKVGKPDDVHNVEAEQQVLGALLLSLDGLHDAKAKGGNSLFFDDVHAAIFDLIVDKNKRGELVSPVTIAQWAEEHEGMKQLGGKRYLARMAGSAISPRYISDYCEVLADLSAKRQIMSAVRDAEASITMGDTPSGIVSGKLEAAMAALEGGSGPKPVSMVKAVTIALEQAVKARSGDNTDLVRTGIDSLDNLVSGFYGGQLILLGGRPSMGKTSVALNIALNAARAGHGVAICSLEMNPEAMAVRALSEQTAQNKKAVTYRDMLSGDIVDWQMDEMLIAAKAISELPIQFLPREFSDLGAMVAGARQAKKLLGGNMKLLIIDYTQLLKSNAKGRYEQITEISIALKALAGSLNIPILALSQLSRALEQREDKRPMLSDLRESGQLEQDADSVLFCYRDEYYLDRDAPDQENADECDAHSRAVERSRNKLEIIVAKQRQGPIGTAHVMCNVGLNRIWERL